jgi:hypothetical protein
MWRPGTSRPWATRRRDIRTAGCLGGPAHEVLAFVFVQNVATVPRPAADVAMRRLLRIPDGQTATERAAQRAFSTSVFVSAVRCLLTYVVLPFVAPALGLAAGVGPAIGIPVGIVAIAANVMTIRRFWAADHRWRWAYTGIAVTVIALLGVLMVEDVASLLG